MKRLNLEGHVYGRLTVVSLDSIRESRREVYWLCECSCGETAVVRARSLRSGDTKSCGCYRSDLSTSHAHTTRGFRTPTYSSWGAMKTRCYNPKQPGYPDYGGRGITVCDRWLHSFENFLADMGERPDGLSLDRIDNDGNYEPGNCRWATRKEQNANKRPYKTRRLIAE